MTFTLPKDFNPGAFPAPSDPRDVPFGALFAGEPEVDWKQGHTLEKKHKIVVEPWDQDGSLSCVAQACARLYMVRRAITARVRAKDTEVSRRDIYPFIRLRNGGAYGYRGLSHLIYQGAAHENLISSFENGKPPSEAYISQAVKKVTGAITASREQNKIEGYAHVAKNADEIAYAIQTRDAVVIGAMGSNQGWATNARVRPPKPGERTWGHFFILHDFYLVDGKKVFRGANSWGTEWGGKDGYTEFDEDYIKSVFCFNPLVIADLPPKWKRITEMKKYIAITGEKDQYIAEGNVANRIPDIQTRDLYVKELKIITGSPVSMSRKEFNAKYRLGTPIPSVAVMHAMGKAYPALADAYEQNRG